MTARRGVKICGLTNPRDAKLATEAGAAYTGVVLAGGPRSQTVDSAREILEASGAGRVAVFGHQLAAEVADVARVLELDAVQLHGDPTPEYVEELMMHVRCAIWPVIRVEGVQLSPVARDVARLSGWLLLDSKVKGVMGGTGVPLEWAGLSDEIRSVRQGVRELRVVVAGGLKPSNVKDAIESLLPDIVDVSSGVERSSGVKDPEAVRAFVRAAHDAWRSPGDGDGP